MDVPALPGIIAKVLGLVEHVLDIFITVEVTQSSGVECNIPQYSTSITDCGELLVDLLGQLIYGAINLGAHLMGSLTTTVG
ncbi:MAG: hypothetical protein JSW38_08135 [Dehalococcoidia bacterium]|nr:MAG: hypothetical protein JSW38_08135 [Dehalococcoidia bacterium]